MRGRSHDEQSPVHQPAGAPPAHELVGARLVHELVEADLVPAWLADRPASMRMGVAANLPGLRAVAVPTCGAGWVPQTVQTIGSRIREDFCLTAAVVEAAVPPLTPVERW